MRHKIVISREDKGGLLKISEYAVLDRTLKNVATPLLQEDSYTLLCEQTYDGKEIERSISMGTTAVVEALRSSNFYPIDAYAEKIAESVSDFFPSGKNEPVTLLFDDIDLFEEPAEE